MVPGKVDGDRLRKLTEGLLTSDRDSEKDITRLLTLLTEVLGGFCILYRSPDGSVVTTLDQWRFPVGEEVQK